MTETENSIKEVPPEITEEYDEFYSQIIKLKDEITILEQKSIDKEERYTDLLQMKKLALDVEEDTEYISMQIRNTETDLICIANDLLTKNKLIEDKNKELETLIKKINKIGWLRRDLIFPIFGARYIWAKQEPLLSAPFGLFRV